MKRGLLIAGLVMILAGCLGTQTETALPPKKHPSLSLEPSGESRVLELSHLFVFLEPALAKGVSYATKGRLKLNHQKIPSAAVIYDFKFQAIILDEDYKIVKRMTLQEFASKNANDPIPFEFNFKLQPNYRFITFNYEMKYFHNFT
jgi:hypothetical protein